MALRTQVGEIARVARLTKVGGTRPLNRAATGLVWRNLQKRQRRPLAALMQRVAARDLV